MRKQLLLFLLSGQVLCAYAQNVGIGTPTPNFPLSFPNSLGDKIALWGTSGAHYGFGIQSLTLQIHTDINTADIAFGYGTSAAFTENMRIKGTGFVGIGTPSPGAKLHVVSGLSGFSGSFFPGMAVEGSGNTYLNFLTPNGNENGILFGKASDNASGGIIYNNPTDLNGFQFRTNGNVTRMVIDNGGNVGIGNTSPNAPLAFPPSLGKKITLYPGLTGDAGFGMSGNRLQIFADNPNADVAIGYDAAGTFNERFALKPTGAFAVNGNTGSAGQILQSNGGGSAATWVSATNTLFNNTIVMESPTTQTLTTSDGSQGITGMSATFTVASNAKVFVSYDIPVTTIGCLGCGASKMVMDINVNSGLNSRNFWDIPNGSDEQLSSTKVLQLSPGTYTVQLVIEVIGPSTVVGSNGSPGSLFAKRMNLMIITQ